MTVTISNYTLLLLRIGNQDAANLYDRWTIFCSNGNHPTWCDALILTPSGEEFITHNRHDGKTMGKAGKESGLAGDEDYQLEDTEDESESSGTVRKKKNALRQKKFRENKKTKRPLRANNDNDDDDGSSLEPSIAYLGTKFDTVMETMKPPEPKKKTKLEITEMKKEKARNTKLRALEILINHGDDSAKDTATSLLIKMIEDADAELHEDDEDDV